MTDGIGTGGLGLHDAGRERALLARIIDITTTGLDLEEVAQGVAAIITEATETDVCFVHLLDADRRRLVLAGATPPFDQHVGDITLEIGIGIAGWVAAHQEPVVVPDKFHDDRYAYLPQLRGEEFASMVSVPMLGGPGRLVGVLNVHARQPRDFLPSDVVTLQAIANVVAPVIDNARLHRRLAQREHAREQFAEQLINAQEQERRRLAGEIHDGISQRIVGLSYHLTAAAESLGDDPAFAAEQIAAARGLAAAALEETRTAIAGLRPSVLDDLGLAAGIESLARSLPGVDVDIDVHEVGLADHVETAIYRITQESLQNVVKHAQATTVTIRLSLVGDEAVLEVADDGRGFDTDDLGDTNPASYGLAGMRERADLINAHLTITSGQGQGTTVRVAIRRT